MPPTQPTPPPDDALRHHTYDGIQEFDKRLPNWWLFTLYGTIVFSIFYWSYYEWTRLGQEGPAQVTAELSRLEAVRLASTPVVDDGGLWKMSRNATFVEAGRATFNTNCASCHMVNLAGAIGPNLVDHLWIHGGLPTEIQRVVEKGVLEKGMPAWGPVIGAKRTAEVVAFILSHHTEGEPIEKQASWTARPPG